MIDLALTLLHSKSLTFADDTKLLKAIMSLLCCSRLQEDLGKVFEWSVANNMHLHENKFEVINYCLNTSKVLHDLPFGAHLTALTHQYVTPGGVDIHPTDVVKDLGVYMSNDCSWSPHIKITELHKQIRWLRGCFQHSGTGLSSLCGHSSSLWSAASSNTAVHYGTLQRSLTSSRSKESSDSSQEESLEEIIAT